MTAANGAVAAAGRRPRKSPVRAIVIRRSDFRESSRIVTCLTREHGRVVGLAKGAHRPDSPFLGRVDFLNEIVATFSADRGGLRLVERAELVRERRALREPTRYLAASHLAHLCDLAMPAERPDAEVFDLLVGGLNLIELCPAAAIGRVVLGLELRLLATLGALPDLDHCAVCDAPLGDSAFRQADSPALVCRRHAEPPRHGIAAAALELLRTLHGTTGRHWPDVAAAAPARLAAALPAAWLAAATEQRLPLRGLLFERVT